MQPNEYLGNIGYLAFIPETTKGSPRQATTFLPIYEESLNTNGNWVDVTPIAGQKFNRLTTVAGQRSHKGDITVLAEVNSTAYFQDIFMTSGAPTVVNGNQQRDATFSITANPRSHTWEVCRGQVVSRYWGVEISKWTPNWNSNELQHQFSISAIGSFQTAVVASVSGTSPTTVTFDTTYDPSPTNGLIAGDLIRSFNRTSGVYTDSTITSLTATTITVPGNFSALTAGDSIFLRPQSPAYAATYNQFLWSNTYFGFGANASAALANATLANQTRVEQGSVWELDHNFESDDGAMRSGGYDPAALVRTLADASLTIKKSYKDSRDIAAFNNLSKSSVAIRHTAGANRQFEFTIIFNNVKTDTPTGNIKFGEIVYSSLTLHPNYDTTDTQAVTTRTISSVTTLT